MTTTVTLHGVDYEAEIEFEGESGDGWHEPYHPACVHVVGCEPVCPFEDELADEVDRRFIEGWYR